MFLAAMFVKALYFKGLALHMLGNGQEAEKVFDAVLAKSPEHPGVVVHKEIEAYIAGLKKGAETGEE